MQIQEYKLGQGSEIKNIIGVVSGKGGVGKSFVCSNLAVELSRRGYKVGILDADITGPSIPKAFGVTEKAVSDGDRIIPRLSLGGIKLISVNLILGNPTQPVMWRGPIVASAISQFFENVYWGKLDYLLVDMPPGTGDVALTVFQSIPLKGLVIVTSPQDLVTMIVEKSVNMAKVMNKKILGLVENMSYFQCPHCNEKTHIYGPSKLAQEADRFDIEIRTSLPIRQDFANKIDQGRVEDIEIKEIKNFVDDLEKN